MRSSAQLRGLCQEPYFKFAVVTSPYMWGDLTSHSRSRNLTTCAMAIYGTIMGCV